MNKHYKFGLAIGNAIGWTTQHLRVYFTAGAFDTGRNVTHILKYAPPEVYILARPLIYCRGHYSWLGWLDESQSWRSFKGKPGTLRLDGQIYSIGYEPITARFREPTQDELKARA